MFRVVFGVGVDLCCIANLVFGFKVGSVGIKGSGIEEETSGWVP